MTTHHATWISITEVCRMTGVSEETLMEIVEHGIIDPAGASPEEWRFEAESVVILHKAVRLRRDLEIDWTGIALALDLLDELDQTRQENEVLRRRLRRFLAE